MLNYKNFKEHQMLKRWPPFAFICVRKVSSDQSHIFLGGRWNATSLVLRNVFKFANSEDERDSLLRRRFRSALVQNAGYGKAFQRFVAVAERARDRRRF